MSVEDPHPLPYLASMAARSSREVVSSSRQAGSPEGGGAGGGAARWPLRSA